MVSIPIETIVRARSESEAAWMLAEARQGTRVIAGGTDLMLHMDKGRAQPAGLVDIRRAGMNEVAARSDGLWIGATATARHLSKSQDVERTAAGLWEAAATLSVPQIRNLATLGGNVANASPAADMVPPVLAMDGQVGVRRGDDVREIPATELAVGPGRTQLEATDLVTYIRVPPWAPGAYHGFMKLGFRDAQIIAVCSLALSCEMEGGVVRRIGIGLGSVAPRCVRASRVERFLTGQRLTRAVGEEAMRLLGEDIQPIDDVRSEAAFRLQVARNYLGDALGRAYCHHLGMQTSPEALQRLRDPAPRPPSKRDERTTPLQDVATGAARPLRIVATSDVAYTTRSAANKKTASSVV